MGYPGDDGGPPDTRAGAPRHTAVWASDPDQEWPAQAPGWPDERRPASSAPASPHYPNASTGQPPRPSQPGGANPAGPAERGRASHRRVPGPAPQPGPAADSRPPAGGDPLRSRDDRSRDDRSRDDRSRDDRSRDDRGRAGSRGRGPAQPTAPPPAHPDAWRRPPRRGGDEIQGGTRQPGRSGTGSQPGGSLWSSGAFRTAGPGGRGPVRGYPPAPGAPDPVYPPGQFSPWNSAELRTAAGRPGYSAGLGPDLAEPGYSQLAVSDPSADATATQTWAVLDEAQLSGEWTSPPAKPSPAAPSPAAPGTGPASAGARGPFEAADAPAADAAWQAGEPRPGGRLAARRGREAAMDAAPGPAGDVRSRDTGGFSSDVGTRDTRRRDTDGLSAGGFGTDGFSTGGFETGGFGTGEFGTGEFGADDSGAGGFGAGDFSTGAAGVGPVGAPTGPGRRAGREARSAGTPATGSRPAARRRSPRQPRKPVSRVKVWMLPAGMLVLVGALITVVYLQFGQGHASPRNAASASQHPTTAASSAPPGPWKHITTRRDDPTALSLAELFPARFTAGSTTAARTVQRASGATCAKLVLGGKLQAALRKGGCTQVMRASYLSTGQKIMATIGVLNLANVTDSEQAGQATGATAFIRQLPGAKGPTHNLMKGTGLEEAEIKGHYLILTWAEFTNLKAPKGPKQRAALDAFSRALVGSTANVSLTSRELLGKPATP